MEDRGAQSTALPANEHTAEMERLYSPQGATVTPLEVQPPKKLETRGVLSAPLWTWFLLAAAICAVSSAGIVFSLLPMVPPMCLASWRLQLNGVFLAALALPYLRGLDFARLRSSIPLLAASGMSLALHMGFWVWALHHTSLTHALLLICSTPILLTILALLRGQPLSWGELSGTAAAALGSILLALGSGATRASSRSGGIGVDGDSVVGPIPPSWQGDLAALLGAVAAIPYFTIGQTLRQWMPVFVYACPVTLVGAIVLASSSLLFEPVSLLGRQEAGIFGWAWNFRMTLCVLYLSVVPGIVGHTGLNTLLKYHSPLVLSLALTSESLIGSAMGWAVGVVALPGLWTWIGGAVVLASTVAVVLAQHVRERGELKRARSGEGKLGGSWDLEG